MSGRRRHFAWVFVSISTACAACSGSSDPTDPCDERPIVAGGAVELGVDDQFTPVAEGQDVDLVFGAQGLWMFIVNARVHDMPSSVDDKGVLIDALDARGARASLFDRGCRSREFVDNGDGSLQLATGFLVPLMPELTSTLDGATFTLRIEVRDVEGRRATDQRTLIAHMPR